MVENAFEYFWQQLQVSSQRTRYRCTQNFRQAAKRKNPGNKMTRPATSLVQIQYIPMQISKQSVWLTFRWGQFEYRKNTAQESVTRSGVCYIGYNAERVHQGQEALWAPVYNGMTRQPQPWVDPRTSARTVSLQMHFKQWLQTNLASTAMEMMQKKEMEMIHKTHI